MDLLIRKKDLYVLGAVLAAGAAILGHHHYDTIQIDRELRAYAEEALVDLFGPDGDRSEWDIITMVDQAKTFHVAGPAWGAVHNFVRRKGDVEMKTFKGVEYYLKREDGKWRHVDSAGCSAFEHHIDGFEEFERRGLEVAASAYDRALGYRRAGAPEPEPAERPARRRDRRAADAAEAGESLSAAMNTTPETPAAQ